MHDSMDNAVALTPNASLAAPATVGGRIQAMPLRSKVSALIGVAALAGIVFAMTAPPSLSARLA